MARGVGAWIALLAAVGGAGWTGASSSARGPELDKRFNLPTIVVAHRGASAMRPEHSLDAYEVAIDQGADVIECDMQPTADRQLVCMHGTDLREVTDILSKPEVFRTHPNPEVTGEYLYDVSSYTKAELDGLRLIQRAGRNPRFDRLYPIVSVREAVQYFLAKRLEFVQFSWPRFANISLLLETKTPAYYRTNLSLPIEELAVEILTSLIPVSSDEANLVRNGSIWFESFEKESLVLLSNLLRNAYTIGNYRFMQLIGSPNETYPTMAPTTNNVLLSKTGLANIAGYATSIGIDKVWLVPNPNTTFEPMGSFVVSSAHEAGLEVYVYTLKPEKSSWENTSYSFDSEVRKLDAFDIQGVFTDAPIETIRALAAVNTSVIPKSLQFVFDLPSEVIDSVAIGLGATGLTFTFVSIVVFFVIMCRSRRWHRLEQLERMENAGAAPLQDERSPEEAARGTNGANAASEVATDVRNEPV